MGDSCEILKSKLVLGARFWPVGYKRMGVWIPIILKPSWSVEILI